MITNVVNSLMLPDWPTDKPLFKYLKKEHANNLFNLGELRVGTLYEFRDQEQYGPKRGDSNEGKKEIYEHIDNAFVEDSSQHNPLSPFAQQFIKLENCKNVSIINNTVSESQISKNCYIYCMSKEFNNRFYEEFQTDVCIIIKSPYKFITCISKIFRNSADFIALSPIKYGERKQSYGEHDEYHASIIKTNEYKYQKEVRAIWEPKNKDGIIAGLSIKVPAKCMKRFCEIYHEK